MTPISLQAFADELVKISQEAEATVPAAPAAKPAERKYPHPALLAGASLAGLGLGYGAGHLTTHGLNAALKGAYGPNSGIPTGVLKAAPVVAGLTGLGVGALQAYTWDKARRAIEEREAQNVSQNP